MFDIGMQELALVCVVALVVLGPERMQPTARQLGRLFARIRKAVRDLKLTVRQAMDEGGSDD